MSLDGIRARVGSIAPTRIMALPRSVQRILEDDVPKLIEVAKAAKKFLDAKRYNYADAEDELVDALASLDKQYVNEALS